MNRASLQMDMFAPPAIERAAEIPAGAVFSYAGRMLRVVKTHGTAPESAVIVEELCGFGTTLPGQFGLWSADAVSRGIARKLK